MFINLNKLSQHIGDSLFPVLESQTQGTMGHFTEPTALPSPQTIGYTTKIYVKCNS